MPRYAAEPELFPGFELPPEEYQPMRIWDGYGQLVESCVAVDTETGDCWIQVLDGLQQPIIDRTSEFPEGVARVFKTQRPLPLTIEKVPRFSQGIVRIASDIMEDLFSGKTLPVKVPPSGMPRGRVTVHLPDAPPSGVIVTGGRNARR